MPLAKSSGSAGARAAVRQNRLLDTARALFVEHGFHQTGIAQIAATSGIRVGQIYRDFESKEAIIAAICESDVEAWLEESALMDAVARKDVKAIRDWVERFGTFDQAEDRCRLVAEIIAEAGRNPRVADIYRRVDARVRKSLSAALTALIPGGSSAKQVDVLAEYILTMGAGAACRRIIHRPQSAG
jgi:AcrR family transcriptional regulator